MFATCDKCHGTRVRGSGETSLGNIFLPSLLEKSKYLPTIVETLSTILVNKYGLVLQNLVT